MGSAYQSADWIDKTTESQDLDAKALRDDFAVVMLLNAARQCSISRAGGIGWLVPRSHAPFNLRLRFHSFCAELQIAATLG